MTLQGLQEKGGLPTASSGSRKGGTVTAGVHECLCTCVEALNKAELWGWRKVAGRMSKALLPTQVQHLYQLPSILFLGF